MAGSVGRFGGPLFSPPRAQPAGQGPLRTGVLSTGLPTVKPGFNVGIPVLPGFVSPTQPGQPGQPQVAPIDSQIPQILQQLDVTPADVAPVPPPANRQLSVDAFVMSRLLESICAHLDQLSDDIYNSAAITNGIGFALQASQASGQHTFASTDMSADPPQALANPWKAYANNSQSPAVVVVRCEPSFTSEPPGAVTVENVILLASLDNTKVNDPSKAEIVWNSPGNPVSIVVPPNQTLYVNVMASQSVKAVYTVIPLRGRAILFTSD